MIASDFNVFRDQFVDWWSCTCFLHTVCELSSPWNWKMPGPANQRRSRFSNLSEVSKRCKSLAKLGLVSDRFWLYEISTLPKKLRTESPTMTACSETATARPITAWRKDSCENLKNHGLTLSLIFLCTLVVFGETPRALSLAEQQCLGHSPGSWKSITCTDLHCSYDLARTQWLNKEIAVKSVTLVCTVSTVLSQNTMCQATATPPDPSCSTSKSIPCRVPIRSRARTSTGCKRRW